MDAAKLGNATGTTSIPGVGLAGAGLGIYGGLQEGGVAGDTQVAAGSAQLASAAASAAGYGSTAAGSALGAAAGAASVVGIPLATFMLLNGTTPVKLDASWWQNMSKSVSDPNSSNYWPAKMQLATMAAQGDPQALAMAKQYGIAPLTPMKTDPNLYGTGLFGSVGGLGRGTQNKNKS